MQFRTTLRFDWPVAMVRGQFNSGWYNWYWRRAYNYAYYDWKHLFLSVWAAYILLICNRTHTHMRARSRTQLNTRRALGHFGSLPHEPANRMLIRHFCSDYNGKWMHWMIWDSATTYACNKHTIFTINLRVLRSGRWNKQAKTSECGEK